MNKAKCPMCGAEVRVPTNAKIGQIVFCDQCDAELEIVSLKPLELDWPLEDYDEDEADYEYEYEGDDYDDDYDDDDYDYDDD